MIEKKLRELERRSASVGQTVTVQRRAALRVLVRRSDHPTAEEVYADVVADVPGISKATVYRALDNLVQLGLARRVHHDGSAARYDGNAERHHHLICDRCGSIRDLDWAVLDAIPLSQFPATAFEVHDFFVNFRGLCRGCSPRKSDNRGRKK